jgi:hypothetical protein
MHDAMNSGKRKENQNQNQFHDECVENLVHRNAWL